jgi:DNA-binding NarL/FixJ family response regulator
MMANLVLALRVRLLAEALSVLVRQRYSDWPLEVVDPSNLHRIASRLEAEDIVVLDTSVDDAESIVRAVKSEWPAAAIILLGVEETDLLSVLLYAEAGAAGFAATTSSVTEFFALLQAVRQGDLLCSPRTAAVLLRRVYDLAPAASARAITWSLTPREMEILLLIEEGLSNKRIADRLCLQTSTVKNHVHAILRKLEVPSRAAAASTYRRLGLATRPIMTLP